jgi:hypothetical protein
VALRVEVREAMMQIVRDLEGASAASRVAAGRLATELDAEGADEAEQPADRATVAELDEAIARLSSKGVGKT